MRMKPGCKRLRDCCGLLCYFLLKQWPERKLPTNGMIILTRPPIHFKCIGDITQYLEYVQFDTVINHDSFGIATKYIIPFRLLLEDDGIDDLVPQVANPLFDGEQ